MNFKINYDNLPILSNYFTRSNKKFDFVADSIQFVEDKWNGLKDKSIPNHQGTVTAGRNGIKFASEETFQGLKHNSLEQYTNDSNRIVCVYYWTGWDDKDKREAALNFIDATIAHGGNASKYATLQLGSFLNLDHLPLIGKYFDPKRTQKRWCSAFSLMLMKIFGADWIDDIFLDPLDAMKLMRYNVDCRCVIGYYK
jgi:hypothetical protein